MSKVTDHRFSSYIDVLNPLDQSDFFSNYWEQQPLHIERTESNPFAGLISSNDIESLLTTNQLYYPIVQLSQSGQSIPADEYTDANSMIVSSRMLERYRSGSTIVLSHAHKLRSELMNLCRTVQRSFMMRCQTNVYLSPPGKQGFNPHFDTHNVFILQVSGNKTFNFYSGGANFPTSSDRFDSSIHSVGEKTEEIALSAGDTLYIPRGMVHDAVADDQEPSLHITLGVYPLLMHELARELIQIGVESDDQLRRSVSNSLWQATDGVSNEDTLQSLQTSLMNLMNEEGLNLALSRLRDEFALDTTPHNQGVLDKAHVATKQDPFSLSINPDAILHKQRSGQILVVRTFGAVMDFSEPFATAVEWLVDHSNATVKDIPELTDDQLAALAEKLRDRNLLL